jgi:cupin fold WbuC family metalloprotein
MDERFPAALPTPTGELRLLGDAEIERALAASRASPRRRVILPFHASHAEPLHRMLNAMQPDSYVRPHRHLEPPKAEAWLVLRGAAALFTFEDDGRVREAVQLTAGREPFGVDLAPGVYHTVIARAPDTVLYEVKPGPYSAADDKAFAPWAPPEGDPDAPTYMASLLAELGRRA